MVDPVGLQEGPPAHIMDARLGISAPSEAYIHASPSKDQLLFGLGFVPIVGTGIGVAEFFASPSILGAMGILPGGRALGKAGKLFSRALPNNLPKFSQQKLSKIKSALKKDCVDMEVGTRRAQRNLRGASGLVEPASRHFGTNATIFLKSVPSRVAVVEELIHLGQLRKLGFPEFISDAQKIDLEIAAQGMLLKLAGRKGWSAAEIESISNYKAFWESLR